MDYKRGYIDDVVVESELDEDTIAKLREYFARGKTTISGPFWKSELPDGNVMYGFSTPYQEGDIYRLWLPRDKAPREDS